MANALLAMLIFCTIQFKSAVFFYHTCLQAFCSAISCCFLTTLLHINLHCVTNIRNHLNHGIMCLSMCWSICRTWCGPCRPDLGVWLLASVLQPQYHHVDQLFNLAIVMMNLLILLIIYMFFLKTVLCFVSFLLCFSFS